MPIDQDTYIVVGSGVFGSSTALELIRAGHKVIVLDRSEDGYCAPDGASNDLNKIVRADYSDPHYRNLAKMAISYWRRSDLISQYYHEVGVLFHTGTSVDQTIAYEVSSSDQFKGCFPVSTRNRLGRLNEDITSGRNKAYFNPRGGWAEAGKATNAVLDEAKRLGAQVYGNAHVNKLLFQDRDDSKRVTGVRCADGRTFHIGGKGQTILCVGAWSEGLLRAIFEEQNLNSQISLPTWSSAQVVITIQLNEEQQKIYRDTPVVLCFENGNYCFEPDSNGLMKIAIHSGGYRFPLPSTNTNTPLTFPTFADSIAEQADRTAKITIQGAPSSVVKEARCPTDQAKQILQNLHYVYPELANAPIVYDRICFYSESLDENWIIDHAPGVKGLVVASGDSGHAFKVSETLGKIKSEY
ncbi:FAD dependent oxidoreductase [Meira miltonrushii]|uniref:FAD dependent oxidoreductase n=1 Tax=Meira miltonrushii TaxID=1280837 RepID=A0A316VJF6_9BASI|nr:FAD dependent oxidoreductase [Meira miltonrushii]PWN37752.1 FAD dependent oxidoreductase [Meira miltonrushii]